MIDETVPNNQVLDETRNLIDLYNKYMHSKGNDDTIFDEDSSSYKSMIEILDRLSIVFGSRVVSDSYSKCALFGILCALRERANSNWPGQTETFKSLIFSVIDGVYFEIPNSSG